MRCVIIDDDKLSRIIVEKFVAKTDFLQLVGSYGSALEAIQMFNNGHGNVDLIFLDVEMPEISGLDFLKTLDTPPQIIIISGNDKYAIDAFDYDVTDFLLKPISMLRYLKAVNKAQKRKNDAIMLSNSNNNEIFIKKKNSTLIRLSYNDILWVEAMENYVVLSTYDEKYTFHFTIVSVSEKFPENKFKRVHRSYVVNVSKIKMIEDNFIIIDTKTGEKAIPIGKSFKDKLLNDLNLIKK